LSIGSELCLSRGFAIVRSTIKSAKELLLLAFRDRARWLLLGSWLVHLPSLAARFVFPIVLALRY
jgi:hypothetical protein